MVREKIVPLRDGASMAEVVFSGAMNGVSVRNMGKVDFGNARDFLSEVMEDVGRGHSRYGYADRMRSAEAANGWDDVFQSMITFCAVDDVNLTEGTLAIGLSMLKTCGDLGNVLEILKNKHYINEEGVERLESRLKEFKE